MATRIDESRLRRSATSMVSSIVTTSLASTMRQRGQLAAADSVPGKPTNNNSARGWVAKKAFAAGSVTAGPWSPPMQSTAKRITSGFTLASGGLEGDGDIRADRGKINTRRYTTFASATGAA